MNTSKFLTSLIFMSILIVSSSGSFLSTPNHFLHKQPTKTSNKQAFKTQQRQLIQTTQHDFIEPPITTFPATPVTNPVTTPVTNPVTTPSTTGGPTTVPPDFPTPPIVTVPSGNPTVPITFPPATTQNPVNPPVNPVTNPVTTPSTTIPGGDPTIVPPAVVVPPGATTGAPAVAGQSWCVVRSGAPETAIQVALDYACGIGGADCSAIQQGASCYNPNSLQNHASYAFNSYYQRNPEPTSCDFGGTAVITNVNPSAGSCIFPTSSSSSTSPTTTSPITTTPVPTPTTESSSGATPAGSFTPPNVLNASSPPLGGGMTGYGVDPPFANTSSVAATPTDLQPFISCIIVVTTIITVRTV